MPQKHNNPSQKPKKKGHKPAHQNSFAFRHNPKSKLTAKILSSPNVGLCQKCHDKIEWRKQYRKYKPLSQPSSCYLCNRRNVMAAYHTICDECALSKEAYRRMMTSNSNSTDTTSIPSSTCPDDANDSNIEDNSIHQPICAMCVKDFAIEDSDNPNGSSSIDHQIQQKISIMEQKLKRPLKLRESKAIERKVIRDSEREKQKAKEERRRLRMEQEGGLVQDDEDVDESERGDSDEEHDEESNDESIGDDKESVNDGDDNDDQYKDDNDDDPFLQAVGGKDKLLTGEAYQKMMLEKEKQRLANLKLT